MEVLDDVHFLHQVEGEAGQGPAVTEPLEIKGVKLPLVQLAEHAGELWR